MPYTTLRLILKSEPCSLVPSQSGTLYGYQKLKVGLGRKGADDPINFLEILPISGVLDTIWCLRTTEEGMKIARKYAAWCAEVRSELVKDIPLLASAVQTVRQVAEGVAPESELSLIYEKIKPDIGWFWYPRAHEGSSREWYFAVRRAQYATIPDAGTAAYFATPSDISEPELHQAAKEELIRLLS